MQTTDDKFKQWIEHCEGAWQKVDSEYSEARLYYEDEQAPTTTPDDKEYIQENLITDTIDRAVGQVISGEIRAVLKGGGEMLAPVEELHDDILDDNNWNESIVPDNMNHFYCEGLGGVKFVENNFARGRYGIGKAEIYALRPGELWLDPNSKNGMHHDDIYRIHPKRVLLVDALNKFGRNDKGNRTKMWSQIDQSTADDSGTETEKFVDLYEIEFKQKEFKKRMTADGQSYREEIDVYYIAKVINKTVVVSGPTPTGYPGFRLIPLIHTARQNVNFGRLPFGLYKKLGQTQDQLNVTASVTLEAVKASIKQLVVAYGLKEDEKEEFKDQAARTDGFFATSRPKQQANIEVFRGEPLPASLIQWRTLSTDRFDKVRGSSGSAQQFQSAASGQLSGKAIGNLQFAGVLPEYSKKANIQLAYKELSRCILHYISKKMAGQPFDITREIDGQEKKIHFNKEFFPGFEPDEYNVFNKETGLINDLSQVPPMDVKVVVEMNLMQKQEFDMNKAILLAQMQKISDKDLLKALYPDDWKQMYENLTAQGGAMALVSRMSEQGPEFVQMVSQMLDQYATLETSQVPTGAAR